MKGLVIDVEMNEVAPKKPPEKIHVYLGACGYKLSVGKRHLTINELKWVLDEVNKKMAN